MTKNEFTFQPIDVCILRERKYSDKDWEYKWDDNFAIQQEKWEKFSNDKSSRFYKVFKINPVKKDNKNYVLVAFPLFNEEDYWGLILSSIISYYDHAFNNNGENLVEHFASEVSKEKLKAQNSPHFHLKSYLPFKTKSIKEIIYATYPDMFRERKNNFSSFLRADDSVEQLSENDLILFVIPNEYTVTQIQRVKPDIEIKKPKNNQENNGSLSLILAILFIFGLLILIWNLKKKEKIY